MKRKDSRYDGLLLISIALVLLALLPAIAAAQESSLAGDTRLERAQSVDEVGIPLDELLHKLSNDQLKLEAGRTCAGQKVQIRLKQRPLRLLMTSLAQLLPGYWEPRSDKKGYRFEMSALSVAKRQRWWQLFLGERERALVAQRAAILQQMQTPPKRSKPGDPNPEHGDPKLMAEGYARTDFFNALPAPLQENIANQMSEVCFYQEGSGVSEPVEEAITVPFRDLPEKAQTLLKTYLSEQIHRYLPGSLSQLNGDWDTIGITFSNAGFIVQADFTLLAGKLRPFPISLNFPMPPDRLVLATYQKPLVALVEKMGRNAPDAWKQLAAYQKGRVWPNDPPATKPPVRYPPLRRAEMLQWLADKADIEYVSDYYSVPCRPLKPVEKERKLTGLLKEELDSMAAIHDVSWKRSGDNLYLFRDNRWYIHDSTEVPAPLLRSWLARYGMPARTATLPQSPPLAKLLKAQMDWEAEVVTSLTPWQIARGLVDYARETPSASSEAQTYEGMWATLFPFHSSGERILKEMRTAQFYATLEDPARTALTEDRLAFESLAPAQQQQVERLVPNVRTLAKQQEGRLLIGLQPTSVNPVIASYRLQFPNKQQRDSRPRVHLKVVVPSPEKADSDSE